MLDNAKPDECESLGQLDAILGALDEPARMRALEWLRMKCVPNGNLPEALREALKTTAGTHEWPADIWVTSGLHVYC